MVLRRELTVLPAWRRQPQGTIASAEDFAESRRIMHQASRNYTFASAFLPPHKRGYVEALYAFLRVGDDFVDVSPGEHGSPRAAIEEWESLYRRGFQMGTSRHPVIRAYLETARRFSIPEAVMDPYFRAMRADLTVSRFANYSELVHYVEGSAMPVGRAMTYILGVRNGHPFAEALARADSLSIAMQLSNFLRDIGEDWDRGRVYLPQDEMRQYGVIEDDLAARRSSPALGHLLRFQADRIEGYYRYAYAGVKMLAAGRWGVLSGLYVYRGIVQALRRAQYDPFQRRLRAGDPHKLAMVAWAWLKSR